LVSQKAFVVSLILATVLVGGLLAFYVYQKTRSASQASYQLNLDQIAGIAYLNGVPIGLTPNHGQLVHIEIFVASQSADGSNMFLADFIDTVGWMGSSTNSTYTVGQTIVMYRIYQDGYAEKTNGGILLTQQMLMTGLRGLDSGPLPKWFEIPVQQWVPV
jgi:hypothetical protein